MYIFSKIGQLLLFFAFTVTQCCFAQEPSFMVSGEGIQPLKVTATDLQHMERASANLKDRSGDMHVYNGVPIAHILQKAKITSGKDLRGKNLSKYLLVKAADGYQVVFSLAELDSSFTDSNVILADQVDGKALPPDRGPFRLIVPGEKIPARSCYKVTGFYIGWAKTGE